MYKIKTVVKDRNTRQAVRDIREYGGLLPVKIKGLLYIIPMGLKNIVIITGKRVFRQTGLSKVLCVILCSGVWVKEMRIIYRQLCLMCWG